MNVSLYDNFMVECKKKLRLVGAQIALTDKCNLKCRHCYVSPQDKLVLDIKEIKRILAQLEKMGCFLLTFTGGEIFTRADIFEILEYSAKRFCVTVMTNGILLDKTTIDFLKTNFIDNIVLSLYGSKAEIHDNFTCQPGSFDKTMGAIINLKKSKVNILVNYVMNKYNAADVANMKKLQDKIGLKIIYTCVITPREDGTRLPEDLAISKEELLRNFFLDGKQDLLVREFSKTVLDFPLLCGAWENRCYISAYGDVRPCVVFPVSHTIGNLRFQSLKEIWAKDIPVGNSSTRHITPRDFRVCNSCKLLKYCGLCPAQSILEKGELGPVRQSCIIAEAKKEFLDMTRKETR